MNKHLVKISITLIFGGEIILLKKTKNIWQLPRRDKSTTNSIYGTCNLILKDANIDLEETITKYELISDSLLQPWKVTSDKNTINIHTGICINGDEQPETHNDYHWVKLDDCVKIEIEIEDKIAIKQYIETVNEEIKIRNLIKNT